MHQTIFILLLIISAIMQALAVATMKKASELTKEKTEALGKRYGKILLVTITMILFTVSFPLYAIGLSGINLAIAQPVFSASIFVATIVLSVLLFHEKVNVQRIAGISVIISGIITVISK